MKYYFILLSCVLFLSSLTGKYEIEDPSLNNLSGADLKQYTIKDSKKIGPVIMSFSSHAKLGLGTLEQKNQLSVLISSDFSGDYTNKGIQKAKWKNITNRFELSPVVTTEELLSTSADISDLMQKGEPFYIAFKYDTPPQTIDKRYVTWKIRNFKILQKLGSDTVNLLKHEPLTLYHKGILEPGRTVSYTTQVIFRGNLKKANFSSSTEDWAISSALIVND